jgi:amino acid transporter
MAMLFSRLTALDPAPVAAIAAVAMVNGILVQILMSARALYGMAIEGLAPQWFGAVSQARRTPAQSTAAVAAAILALALAFPLVGLAEATSFVILAVFALVNLSLWSLARGGKHARLARWRWLGLAGAALSAALMVFQATALPG